MARRGTQTWAQVSPAGSRPETIDRKQTAQPNELEAPARRSSANAEASHGAGDLAQLAEAAWLDLASGGDLAHREALESHLARHEGDLVGDSTEPLLHLLARTVALRSLQAAYYDLAAAHAAEHGLSERQLRQVQKHQDRAQRAYLSAIRLLATVRRIPRLGFARKPTRLNANDQ